MKRLALLVPLAIAACHSQPNISAKNASMAEIAAKTKDAIKIEPGEWVNKTEVTALDLPGIKDPRMAQTMGDAMKRSRAQSSHYCVTPAQAARPSSEMFAGRDNGDCRYDHFTMAGGRIDAVLTCQRRSAGGMTMTMAGTYSPTAYDMTMDMKMANAGMPGGMTMKAHTQGQRTGDCKPGEKG